MIKRILKWLGALILLVLIGAGVFVGLKVRAYNNSMEQVYDVAPPAITRSTDPAVLARGKHVAESLGGCATSDCHGTDLGGGKPMVLGPLGVITGPNITPAGRIAQYSDGQIARVILHGLNRDGRSLRFMPSQDVNWLPDEDVQAVISYLRTVPAVARPDGATQLGVMAKVLDQQGLFIIDVARRIDHKNRAAAPAPAPTAAYGAFMSRACVGCHGEHLSGGPIPGAPPSMPTPANITPHDSGIKGWTYADFDRLLSTGMRKNGKKLDPFMPIEALSKLNDIERHALWAHLEVIPALPFGKR